MAENSKENPKRQLQGGFVLYDPVNGTLIDRDAATPEQLQALDKINSAPSRALPSTENILSDLGYDVELLPNPNDQVTVRFQPDMPNEPTAGG